MDRRDPRTIRLFDIQPDEHISIRCLCGHSSQWAHGTLQRLNKLASDVLVYDLQFKIRCERCKAIDGFRITVRTVEMGGPREAPRSTEVVVVEGHKDIAAAEEDFFRIRQPGG